VQWILGVLAIVAVVGLLGTVLFSDSASTIHGYEEVLSFVEGDARRYRGANSDTAAQEWLERHHF
jgi:hypothetical protein